MEIYFWLWRRKTEKDIWKRKTYSRGGKEKQRSKRRKTFGEGTYIFAEEKEKEKKLEMEIYILPSRVLCIFVIFVI